MGGIVDRTITSHFITYYVPNWICISSFRAVSFSSLSAHSLLSSIIVPGAHRAHKGACSSNKTENPNMAYTIIISTSIYGISVTFVDEITSDIINNDVIAYSPYMDALFLDENY